MDYKFYQRIHWICQYSTHNAPRFNLQVKQNTENMLIVSGRIVTGLPLSVTFHTAWSRID